MDIALAMVLSIGVKGLAAVLEVVTQALITNGVGVEEYGNYAFFVSMIEGGYYVLFSGSIKLNTFYLSTPESSIQDFKKKYTVRFVLPVIAVIELAFVLMKNPTGVLAGIVLFLFYLSYDNISTFYARRKQLQAMLGEYMFGRIALLIGIISVIHLNVATIFCLFVLYGIQFIVIVLWFVLNRKKIGKGTEETEVSLRKLFEYQISDVANSLISYSPTILQFVFGGAFTAGFTGIVTIVKRFINFISGPTAKIFLPEFSKLYKSGETEKLKKSYVMIVRIQMVFIGTVGAILIGFPEIFLKLFSPDLIQYSGTFMLTSICIMFISGMGPVTGLLQMTGNEHICNRNQWVSIGAMILACIVLHKEALFGVYGLCVQCVVEGGLKYYSVCRWFKENVIPVKAYLLLWLPVALGKIAVELFHLQYSYIALAVCTFCIFLWNAGFALQDEMIKETVKKLMNKKDK